jgi:DNA-binding NtrC family response regulator
VKTHDGAIAVESTPGRGTTFRIYFPATAESATVRPTPPATTPRGHGERLLLVDDEPSVTMIAELMLERLGYAVDAFSEPEAARAAFREAADSFAAVVTDFTMPNMSGLDLAQEIFAIRRNVPVLLMSGNLQVNDVARAKAAGICAIIDKPFSMQQLAQRIETAIASAAKSA